jgi:archaellum component FlaF (FlaF/FlaG flagellin family)
MLEKIVVADLIEVIENGSVQVRTKTSIIEDEKEISSSFHRKVIVPGDDYSAEDSRVKAICSAVHTESVIASYKAAIAAERV